MLIHITVRPLQDIQGLPFHPGWAKQVSKWLLPAPAVEHEEQDLGAQRAMTWEETCTKTKPSDNLNVHNHVSVIFRMTLENDLDDARLVVY